MIRTFIFFDLETTGLYMPKITEMSLIAVSRTALCNTTDSLPRVLHKLVLPIHPNVNISKKIQMLTGLSNENLEDTQHFNSEAYNLMINFISRQKEPTCFVAYNGNNFDYPILLSEFKNIDKSFSENVLSIDMLYLIKDFFLPKQDKKEELNVKGVKTCSPSNAESKQKTTARRKLYFTNSKPINFKLATIYKHMLGSDPESAHCAEGDCLTMIHCAIQLGTFFVNWADSNAVPLVNHTKQ